MTRCNIFNLILSNYYLILVNYYCVQYSYSIINTSVLNNFNSFYNIVYIYGPVLFQSTIVIKWLLCVTIMPNFIVRMSGLWKPMTNIKQKILITHQQIILHLLRNMLCLVIWLVIIYIYIKYYVLYSKLIYVRLIIKLISKQFQVTVKRQNGYYIIIKMKINIGHTF